MAFSAIFYFFILLWEKEGKCTMHRDARAPCVGLQYVIGIFRPLDNLPPDLPTKPFPAG